MRLITRWYSDNHVEKKYVAAGTNFGDAASFLYIGEPEGFKGLLSVLEKWEREYAHRGFRTVPLEHFIDLGGYGTGVGFPIGVKREANESPILHAKLYKDTYLGKVEPVFDMSKAMKGEVQTGVWTFPPSKTTASLEMKL